MMHIEFHPKYYDIFQVTLHSPIVYVFYINNKENKIEEKIECLCSNEDKLIKTIFSHYND